MQMGELLAHSKCLISMESAIWHQSLLNYHRYQWMGCSAEIYDVGNNICQMEVVEISITVICVQCIHSYVNHANGGTPGSFQGLLSMESAFWHQSLLNHHRYQWMGCSAEIYDVGNNI